MGAFADQAVTERCAYCDFTISAPVAKASAAFAAHKCDRPPKPEKPVRRRTGFALRPLGG
jgi:hypothetical protein